MDWEALISVFIFIVVVILSLASKAQESRKIAQRQREKQRRQPQQLSGKARQQVYGRAEPKVATAREGHTPPPVPPQRPVKKPRPVEQELLETLFGVKLGAEEQEAQEAQPARDPNVRDSTREMVQRLRGASPAEPRQARRRTAPPPVDGDEGPTITAADIRAKEKEFEQQIRAIRQRMHRGMRQGLAQAAPEPQEQRRPKQRGREQRQPAPKPVRPVRRQPSISLAQLFHTQDDLRRAIIVSEVLGKPKSMQDESLSA